MCSALCLATARRCRVVSGASVSVRCSARPEHSHARPAVVEAALTLQRHHRCTGGGGGLQFGSGTCVGRPSAPQGRFATRATPADLLPRDSPAGRKFMM